MQTGIQIRDVIPANSTHTWFTFNWNPSQHVIWTVVPVSINTTAAELTWTVAVQRTSSTAATYYITVANTTAAAVNFEGRYAIFP